MSEGKKKLVIRVGTFPNPSETFVTMQAKLAMDLGYDVHILADRKQGLDQSSQSELITSYGLLDRTTELQRIQPQGLRDRASKLFGLIASGLPMRILGSLNPLKYGWEGLKGTYLFHFHELRSCMDADIVHIQFGSYKYPFDRMKASGLFKGKLVTTFHGFDAHFTEKDKDQQSGFYSDLFALGEAFTVNSDYLKEKVLSLGCPEHKLMVIPVPVDTGYFKPALSTSEGLRLLSVGRLTELKGHAYGLKAVRALIDKGHSVQYHIVGKGEEQQHLEAFITDLDLGRSVILHGRCTQSEVLKSMQDSDIYLMTSITDHTGRGEAQGLVTGEAQACGLPVVAFESGGVASTLADGKTGFLVPEKDVEAMAERLAFLIEHPEERKRMAEAARSFVEQNFSLQVISQKWAELYAELETSS